MPSATDFLAAVEGGELPKVVAAASGIPKEDLRSARAAKGRTALHLAASAGHEDVCTYLVEQLGVDVNAQDEDGDTALAAAVTAQEEGAAEVLLALGADPNLSKEGAAGPLHRAAGHGLERVVRRLLASGAAPDAPSESGAPLFWAAGGKHASVVQQLLVAGADVNSASRKGLTPLFMAAAVGADDCFRILLDAGADVLARAYGGFTPLHVAAEGGKLRMAEALLKAGADPHATDDEGHTPVKVAGMRQQKDVVELLLKASAKQAADPKNFSVDDVEQYMRDSKKELEEREARMTSMDSGGAASVRIEQPEVEDEALAEQFKRKGNEFFVAKDYKGAAEVYGLALKHWVNSCSIWGNRSACWLRLEEHEKAMDDARVARTLDPHYVKGWYREGQAAMALRQWEDAGTAFFQAAQLQPGNDEFLQLTRDAIERGREEQQQQQGQQPEQGAQ